MINLHNYKGFQIFNNSFSSQEIGKLKLCSFKYDFPVLNISGIKYYNEEYIPLAGTDIMPLIFKYEPKPDYYPDFLSEYLKRKIYFKNEKIPKNEEWFIKPADKYKRFTGFIKKKFKFCKKKPPFWISEIKYFKSEFRYYITEGKIIYSAQYSGKETEVPDISYIKFPETYSGAADFGYTVNNEFLLIEAQHPYSCGWYGDDKDFEIYIQWIIDGFIYMKKQGK